jgi:uncharacterized membrane-anchored protein
MKKKYVTRLAAAGLILCAIPASATVAPAGPEAKAALAEMPADVRAKTLELEQSLHPSGGTVAVPGGKASLELGDRYYFVPADEAKKILVNAWGNPPDAVTDVLGMVFPKGRTFYDGTWGAVVQYEDTGHVDDKDAAEQDYDEVLAGMKEGEAEASEAARKAGYPGATLVGWAQAPSYDGANKTLIWARNIKFDDSEGNTLNYDIRKLARTGVLSLNMVDSMSNLGAVRSAAADLGQTVRLDAGSRYADFNSSTDHMADYGLAGLVAAGAGAAVAKKAGILGVLLLFLKKGFVVILAALAGAWAWFKRKFRGGDEGEQYAGDEYDASTDDHSASAGSSAEGENSKTD